MNNQINGLDILQMISNGSKFLSADIDRINALNVFPVPDGDTGTNMRLTIEGGASTAKDENIGSAMKAIARSMVLSARGNSGVILSQFFKGIALYLEKMATASVLDFANALISGTKKSYSVVANPTEGTILTVMREAGDNALKELTDNTTLEEYLISYIKHAEVSLANTPNLLPVLKKAGVIDSGGAGFVLIMKGMLAAVRGEEIDVNSVNTASSIVNTAGFNADSELTYGYCTEFILQLQNSKVNPETFDLNILNEFLYSIGNSIVSFKDDDIVKVHVHTFDPGLVLQEGRKYGEFLTIKIENMNVQHSEIVEATEMHSEEVPHKENAIVTVATGDGLENAFKEIGADIILSGGQTMNTSTKDFIDAFDSLNATNIYVYPNNGNILLAAKQAASEYDKANIYVIPTKTIAQGFSAISMASFDFNTPEEIVEGTIEAINNVSTLEVTYSIRDTSINDIDIKKNDCICIYNDELISANKNRIEAIIDALKSIKDLKDKQVLTLICGKDSHESEINKIKEYVNSINRFIELYPIKGNQDIYSYIIGIE